MLLKQRKTKEIFNDRLWWCWFLKEKEHTFRWKRLQSSELMKQQQYIVIQEVFNKTAIFY